MDEDGEEHSSPPLEFVFMTNTGSNSTNGDNVNVGRQDGTGTGTITNKHNLTNSTYSQSTRRNESMVYPSVSPQTHLSSSNSSHSSNNRGVSVSGSVLVRKDRDGLLLGNKMSSSHSAKSGRSRRELSAQLINSSARNSWANLSGYDAGRDNNYLHQHHHQHQHQHLHLNYMDKEDTIFQHRSADRPARLNNRRFSHLSDPGRLLPTNSFPDSFSKLHLSDPGMGIRSRLIPAAAPTKSVLVPQFKRRASIVTFSTIEIRQYDRILGDNPSCSSGPSLSIGWSYDKEQVFHQQIDDYEYGRIKRYDDTEMVLSRSEREHILIDLGYSRREIITAVRSNVRHKKKRRQTLNNLPIASMEEKIEGASKKISRIMGKRRGSKYLYEEWVEGVTDHNANDSSSTSSLKSSLKRLSSTINENTDKCSQLGSSSIDKYSDFLSYDSCHRLSRHSLGSSRSLKGPEPGSSVSVSVNSKRLPNKEEITPKEDVDVDVDVDVDEKELANNDPSIVDNSVPLTSTSNHCQ